MKYLYLLIIILSLSACQNSAPGKNYQRSEHSKIAEKITAKTAQKIEAETGLRLFGVGGGMMNNVRMMAMSFQCLGEITMEQGRELVAYCINEYLAAINESEEIRPYLIHYPFTVKDVEIRIFIYNMKGGNVSIDALAFVGAIEGKIQYDIKQPGLPSLKEVHEEAYEEAIQLLETQTPINKIRKNIYHM